MTRKHVMVDTETLGVTPWSVVLSVGAVVFDPVTGETGSKFYMNVDRKSCEDLGLVVDPKVEAWWGDPSRAEAWSQLQADPMPAAGVARAFCAWFNRKAGPGCRAWAHGSSFDYPLLGTLIQFSGETIPWDFKLLRDTRTLFELAELDFSKMKKENTYHNALDDAVNQAAAVTEAYRILAEKSDMAWKYEGLVK